MPKLKFSNRKSRKTRNSKKNRNSRKINKNKKIRGGATGSVDEEYITLTNEQLKLGIALFTQFKKELGTELLFDMNLLEDDDMKYAIIKRLNDINDITKALNSLLDAPITDNVVRVSNASGIPNLGRLPTQTLRRLLATREAKHFLNKNPPQS